MRLAIFALTEAGVCLAQKIFITDQEDSVDMYVSARLFSALSRKKQQNVQCFPRIAKALQEAFPIYDALVCIMATGIVVRSLAPLLQNKMQDPAVIVFDEQGKHGISLLSGHVGGANALTRRLCAMVGADPVITTATDSEGKLAPDSIAEKLAWRPYPKGQILAVNRAILQGKSVLWQIDARFNLALYYRRKLLELGQKVVVGDKIPEAEAVEAKPLVITVTSQQNLSKPESGRLYMLPRRLIAGVGCRKNISAELIQQALAQATASIGTIVKRISVLATTTHKAQEQGLLATAKQLNIPLHCFDNETMQAKIEQYHLPQSDFVRKTLGIGNVCEAAAYAEAGAAGGRLALPKTKYEKVTVALIWEK